MGLGVDFEDCGFIIYDLFVGDVVLDEVVLLMEFLEFYIVLVIVDLSFVDIELMVMEKCSFFLYDVLR